MSQLSNVSAVSLQSWFFWQYPFVLNAKLFIWFVTYLTGFNSGCSSLHNSSAIHVYVFYGPPCFNICFLFEYLSQRWFSPSFLSRAEKTVTCPIFTIEIRSFFYHMCSLTSGPVNESMFELLAYKVWPRQRCTVVVCGGVLGMQPGGS